MAALITLDDYKTIKGISTSNTEDDAKLTSIIDGVSIFVQSYCSRNFIDYYSTALVEYYDNFYKADLIQLNNFPVVEVVSVSSKNLGETAYTLIDPSGYALDALTDSIFRLDSSSGSYRYTMWAEGPKAVKVEYKFGYEELPGDLKLALADLIYYYSESEYKVNQTIGSNSLTSAPVFNSNPAQLPGHIKRVFDLYKNGI